MLKLETRNSFLYSIFSFYLLFFFIQEKLSPFSFVAVSDLHIGKPKIAEKKRAFLLPMLTCLNDPSLDARCVIIAGDLTHNGQTSNCCSGQSQWDEFCYDWLETLSSSRIGADNIYLCPGNHDMQERLKRKQSVCFLNKEVETVKDKLISRHGSLNYSFNIEGVHFICCSVYPDKDGCVWLKNHLQMINFKTPVVIFFHYNLIGSEGSLWLDSSREDFYEIIKCYNVIGIFTGHKHWSGLQYWYGIPVVSVGGFDKFALCFYQNDQLTVAFVDLNGCFVQSD